ncbi:hypothetical protein [Calothrix sp. PCC 6303]|uniref:hypothetical protein n=1 Tax=Calothrix sp. PCC 6303 TaxID=1170562 RepID=UPI0002A04841|nr:hypothetical protein [Calothrix sp. PCC 6303]AFZ00541.1 hypothetical protein Cal6303_1493 [Calothrix sp. PCC 6303]
MRWKITLFSLCLVGSNILPAEATFKRQKVNTVKGNCGKLNCGKVLKDLRTLYPDYVWEFEKACPYPQILGLQVGVGERGSQQVWFNCWEAKKDKKNRYGSYIGTLPLRGNESKFLIPLPTSSPYTPELNTRYADAIEKAQFKCATKSGNFNILDEQKNAVQLQCYFQAGVQPVDLNNDFASDGEVSRGAGVDEILGIFPISGNI